jgi:hypothetical protein
MVAPNYQNTTSSRTSAHTGVAIPYGGAVRYDVVNRRWLQEKLTIFSMENFRKIDGDCHVSVAERSESK